MMISKKSIFQATFVIGYEKDLAIRTKQFDIEKALSPLNVGQSVNTNFPDTENPQAARITFGNARVSVLFSQVSAQMVVNVDNANGKTLDEVQMSLAKRINLFQNCVNKIIPSELQRERGLVISVHYLVDATKFPDVSVFEYIQSRFMRIDSLGEPANAMFTVGYKTDDKLFFTLSISHFKHFKFAPNDFSSAIAARTMVDILKLPLLGSGIELKIDVNSIPLVGEAAQPADVTGMILKKALDFVRNDADKFMGVQ